MDQTQQTTKPETTEQPKPTAPQAALATKKDRPLIDRLRGFETNPGMIEEKLRVAAKEFHLVTPATSCGQLPEGCAVAFSPVLIDVEHETYAIPGSSNRGLAKVALDRISQAAGISWAPEMCARLDDGSDPHYCHYRVVGRVRHFDGTTVVIQGEKEMDAREGSPQIESLIAKSAKKAQREAQQKGGSLSDADARRVGRGKAENQIRELRLHILSHAETKARLRAIRSLGIRTSYEEAELEHPFVVARIQFTGKSEDPELRRMFAEKTADAFLGATSALYAGAPRALSAPAAGHAPPPPALPQHAPPPVGRVAADEDDGVIEARQTPVPAAPKAAGAPQGDQKLEAGADGGGVMRFGSAKGTSFRDADEDDLAWYAGALKKSIKDPEKAQYIEGNKRDLAAIDHELKRRAGEDDGL
jgi:hypothetical protein